MNMATHIDLDDARFRDAAAQILSRHDVLQPEAGATAAVATEKRLAELREDRGDRLTVTIARRELRRWLRFSTAGKDVEAAVAKLLVGEQK